MTQSGFCVTAPPYTVGQPVPFTADAMEKETPLQSSEMVRTCSEDTRIFPGTVILKFLCYLSCDNNTDTYAVHMLYFIQYNNFVLVSAFPLIGGR